MKRVMMLLTIMAVCLSFGSALAAPTISLVPNAPSVTEGDQIFIDVVLSYGTGDPLLLSGALDFTYDDTVAILSDFSFGPVIDAGLSVAPVTATAGQIDNFAFSNFSGVSAGTLASMIFDTTGTGAGAFDVFADPSFFGGWYLFPSGAPFDASQVILEGAAVQVNAVPIPGSLLLLGSGLIGLVGLGRKKRS